MKVLYILNHTISANGATKAIMGLTRPLKRMGVVPVFMVPDRNDVYHELLKEGYEVVVLRYRPNVYPCSSGLKDKLLYPVRYVYHRFLNCIALRKLVCYLRNSDIDVIHTNVSVLNIGLLAARKTGIPHVLHVREYADLDFGLHYIPSWENVHESWSDTHNLCVCITNGVAEHHGLTGKTYSRVIYDGVYPKMERAQYNHGDYFFYAGRIEYAKGLDILIEAYEAYRKMVDVPLPLIVAGSVTEEKYMQQLQQQVQDAGMQKYVRFLGSVPDVSVMMSKARAVIVPSRNEGFGFCMSEAMFEGSLCIVNKVAGLAEQLENGMAYTGREIAMSFTTVHELADRLVEVTVTPDSMWHEMRMAAFDTVNNMYTQEMSAKQIYNIYKELMEKFSEVSRN